MFSRLILMGFAAVAGWASAVHGQDFPNRPIRMVIGGAAGGTSDILAQMLSSPLAKNLGQPIVSDIRPGAGGNIAFEFTAKAVPDGHTVLMVYPAFTTNPALYGNLKFDPMKDFAPITLLVEMPVVLVVHPQLPAQSVQELIALARREPGKLNFGSSGNGGVGHLVGELFNSTAGVRMVHIPYKGNGPALVDVMTGVLSLTFSDVAGALPYVRGGKMRALGIAAEKRHPKLPDMPTMSEAGVAGFTASSWFGMVAPAGTPQPVLNKLNDAFVKVLHSQEMRERLVDQGFIVSGNSQAEFGAFLRNESAKWGKVIRDTGVTLNKPAAN